MSSHRYPAARSPILRRCAAAIMALAVLAFWRFSYPLSCLSLLAPLFIGGVIAHGRYQIILHRRRYRADYYFRHPSPLHRLASARLTALLLAGLQSLTCTLTLSVFVALGKPADLSFLLLIGVLMLLLYPIAGHVTERFAAPASGAIVRRHLLVMPSSTISVAAFIIYLIHAPIPAYVDPSSLGQTIDAASQQVASLCPALNLVLKSAQEFSAMAWFAMLGGTGQLQQDVLQTLSWLLFSLYGGLALIAMGNLTAELLETADCGHQSGEHRA